MALDDCSKEFIDQELPKHHPFGGLISAVTRAEKSKAEKSKTEESKTEESIAENDIGRSLLVQLFGLLI